MLQCLGEWKPGFFQFCSFLNISNHFDLFCNHLVLTGSSWHISIESCCHLKNRFLLSRILLQLEYWAIGKQAIDIRKPGQGLSWKMKNEQDRFHSLMSIPVIITTATLTRVETEFLELLIFYQCWYATMSLLQMAFPAQFSRFRCSLSQQMP